MIDELVPRVAEGKEELAKRRSLKLNPMEQFVVVGNVTSEAVHERARGDACPFGRPVERVGRDHTGERTERGPHTEGVTQGREVPLVSVH